jgi:GH25 family lysozyme M1 (1,4-beta-N-acetylmuramidase)
MTSELHLEDTACEYLGLDAAADLRRDVAAMAADVFSAMADGIDEREAQRILHRAEHILSDAGSNMRAWAESIIANVKVERGLTMLAYDMRVFDGDARAKRPEIGEVTVGEVLQWAEFGGAAA